MIAHWTAIPYEKEIHLYSCIKRIERRKQRCNRSHSLCIPKNVTLSIKARGKLKTCLTTRARGFTMKGKKN
jgi:hypothetical protein